MWMTLTVTQGHRNRSYSTGHMSLPIGNLQKQHLYLALFRRHYHSFYSVRDCLWPWEVLRFRWDGWNHRLRALSDSCENISKLIRAIFPEVLELERFQTAKVTFKVTQGHWCHSTGYVYDFLLGKLSIVTMSRLYRFRDIVSYFPKKLKRSYYPEHVSFGEFYHVCVSTSSYKCAY